MCNVHKVMVNDTTAHAQKIIYWASVSKPHLLDKMYVCTYCLYILYICGNLGSLAQFMGGSTMTPRTVTTTCVLVTLGCLNAKFRTQAMNSHNMDRDHSQTCLFNTYSNGGYHTTPWQARVISSVDAISISAVLYRTWCAGRVARAVYIYIYMYIYGMSVIL